MHSYRAEARSLGLVFWEVTAFSATPGKLTCSLTTVGGVHPLVFEPALVHDSYVAPLPPVFHVKIKS